jgi:hypothetical protein
MALREIPCHRHVGRRSHRDANGVAVDDVAVDAGMLKQHGHFSAS